MTGHRSRVVVAGLTLVLLASLVGGCTSRERTNGIGTATSPTAPILGASHAAGIKLDARLLTSAQGASVLEVRVTTLRRQLGRSCPDAQNCPEEFAFLVRSSALVDYRLSALSETDDLVVENEVDAISSVTQVLTFENIEPGDHCIAVFSQILQLKDGTVVGREGMIGTYEHVTLSAGDSQPTSVVTHCSTSGLTAADGTFVALDEGGCGGLPNGITTDPTGSKLPDDVLMVLAPACPQDIVTVIFRDGEIVPEETRLLHGEERAGFYAFVMPRLSGRWRVATLPVERYRGTIPDGSGYWDIVISPPREF